MQQAKGIFKRSRRKINIHLQGVWTYMGGIMICTYCNTEYNPIETEGKCPCCGKVNEDDIVILKIEGRK